MQLSSNSHTLSVYTFINSVIIIVQLKLAIYNKGTVTEKAIYIITDNESAHEF